jgi:hypothetical protein
MIKKRMYNDLFLIKNLIKKNNEVETTAAKKDQIKDSISISLNY